MTPRLLSHFISRIPANTRTAAITTSAAAGTSGLSALTGVVAMVFAACVGTMSSAVSGDVACGWATV